MTVETTFNEKLLQGVQMLHGAVFSKRAPLAAGGKSDDEFRVLFFASNFREFFCRQGKILASILTGGKKSSKNARHPIFVPVRLVYEEIKYAEKSRIKGKKIVLVGIGFDS